MRVSREISLGSSLHRASSDALIYSMALITAQNKIMCLLFDDEFFL